MRKALLYLKKSDPVLRAIIEQVGPFRIEYGEPQFHSLAEAIVYQQLNGKAAVTIFLVNGVKLQGIVTWFDNFCVLLRRDGHSQLVYKHAISTIMPGQPIQLTEFGDAEAGD